MFVSTLFPSFPPSLPPSLPPFLLPQLFVAIMEQIPPNTLGLEPGSALLTSLKQCVVELARSCSVVNSIQLAAQAVLRTGWVLMLPTVSERASALTQLLPVRDGGCGLQKHLVNNAMSHRHHYR